MHLKNLSGAIVLCRHIAHQQRSRIFERIRTCLAACDILETMPFTFSHAAAVWPLQRTRLVLSALIIGSFAPDFAYFFFLTPRGLGAHSIHGMFLYDLPLSLIALLVFQTFLKQPATMLLPKGFRARLKPEENRFTFWPPARLALIVVSILVGIATHLLWDSFTHVFYWPYRHWSFLRLPVYLPIEGNVQMYRVLQDGSSLFGLVVVAVWIWVWYRATEPHELPSKKPYTQTQIRVITVIVPALALAVGLLKAYVHMGVPSFEFRPILHFSLNAGITATTFLGIGLLICGVIFRRQVAVAEPLKAE